MELGGKTSVPSLRVCYVAYFSRFRIPPSDAFDFPACCDPFLLSPGFLICMNRIGLGRIVKFFTLPHRQSGGVIYGANH